MPQHKHNSVDLETKATDGSSPLDSTVQVRACIVQSLVCLYVLLFMYYFHLSDESTLNKIFLTRCQLLTHTTS